MMAASLLIAILLPGLLLAGFWRLAHLERAYVVPSAMCLLGGGAVFIPAGFVNGYVEVQTGVAFTIISVVVAPLFEELLKCLPALFFVRDRPRASRGLLLGLAAGTGFAMVENAVYAFSEPDWRVALARALSTSLAHATSTALIVFVICQLFKHEHHHRGADLSVAVAAVVVRRVALRVALRAFAPALGRQAGAVALVAFMAGATFLIGFAFVWFTVVALLDELKAEAVIVDSAAPALDSA